ncbi:MAG TPA: hypothetical protein VFZ79_00395 [Acidimicrobiales bacterium]
MTISAGAAVLAAEGTGLVDRWRDIGPVLWVAAGGLAVAWLAVLGLLGAVLDPRKVRPGPAVLEVQGSETPAVVNLITTDWDLGHEAIPATLIDLAARRYVEIDLVGERTFVQVRANRADRPGDGLTRYEEMVLDHVRRLAGQTGDGRVPAEALTTGPDETAKRWWRHFRSAVVHDARDRGLSRPRWSSGVKAALVVAAVPVALAVALAASTLPDDPDDPDDSPVGAALWSGVLSFAGLSGVAGSRSGERDTPEGREAAARWLGLHDLLEEDPLFAEQPPSAVAIWDHLLAHGTALGVAHGVVQALPLGAESEREAWSSVGGHWRVVRVRYPRRLPPGYGRHPAVVTLLGLLQLAVAVLVLGQVGDMAATARDTFDTGTVGGVDIQDDLGAELPAGVDTGIGVALAVATAAAGALALRGGAMALVGLADLITGRAEVEGRVLRRRERVTRDDDGRAKRYVVHLAVDDGSEDKIRAWRFRALVPGRPGQTVRGRVSGRLRHVRDLEVVAPRAEPVTAGIEGGTVTAVESTTAAGPAQPPPVPPVPGLALPGGMPGPVGGIVSAVAAAGAMAGAGAARDGAPETRVPPPPLPADDALSAAAGRRLTRDPDAAPHPAALPGGSAIYRTGPDGHVQVVWVPLAAIGVYRHLPAAVRHELPGLGDEAYRARFGGGVMARRGDHVVMVTPHLPGLDAGERDEVARRVALATIDHVDRTGPVPRSPAGTPGGPPSPGDDG